MAFSPKKIQKAVDKLITTTGQTYRETDEIIAKIKEEKNEIYEAAQEYKETPRLKTLGNLRKEFGDLLYTVCCLANSYGKSSISKNTGRNIPLDEAFEQTSKEHQARESRKENLDHTVEILETVIAVDPRNTEMIKEKIGALLFAIVDFVPVCCEKDMENIDLDHAFILTLNKKRAKKGYVKEKK